MLMGISSRIDLDIGTQPLTTNKPDFLGLPYDPRQGLSFGFYDHTHTTTPAYIVPHPHSCSNFFTRVGTIA